MSIGKRIKIRREELGMTQEELAKLLGYKSRSSINKIELGANGLTQRKIKCIANALHTTPSYIMGWSDDLNSIDTVMSIHEYSLSKEIKKKYGSNSIKFLDALSKLDNLDKAKIIERIEVLLENDKYK